MIKNNWLQSIKNISVVKKATLAYFLSNILVKGVAIISGLIFTRIMSEEQYGIVSTYQSWQSVLSIIITLNLAQGVFNNGMLEYKEDRDGFIESLIAVSTASALIYMGLFAVFQEPISQFFELDTRFVWIILLSCLFTPAYSYWNAKQRYEFKYKAISILSVSASLLSVTIGILLVLKGNETEAAFGRIIGIECVPIALGIIFFLGEGIKNHFKPNWKYCTYALKYNIPLLPHYISMYILSSSDRIMITKMVNAESTAIYSVAYSVFSVVFIFWSSLEASLTPWIYEKLSIMDYNIVRNVTAKILMVYGMVSVVVILFAPEMMFVLAPKSYYEGVYIIPSVATSAFFMATFSLYLRIELYYKKTKFSAVATGICALLNVILNFFGIRVFGYIVAGYTTLISYALLTLIHYLYVRKNGHSHIFSNFKIFMISVLLIVFSVVCSLTYSRPLIRYSLIAIIMAVVVIKRKKIVSLIKQFTGRKV